MSPRAAIRLSVGLVVAGLVVRTFVVLGLVVPIDVSASSMAPTLRGPHRVATCPVCERQFDVPVDHGRAPFRANCPNCGAVSIDVSSAPVRRGDAIWIDRSAFLFRDPARWEVVVFRCPENAATYCIKRIVGLPGESIDIRDGELIVDGAVVLAPFHAKYAWPPAFPVRASPTNPGPPWRLGDDEFFVLGDNGRVSSDGRTWRHGPALRRNLLLGKALWLSSSAR